MDVAVGGGVAASGTVAYMPEGVHQMKRPTLRLNDGFDHTSAELREEVRELQRILNQEGFGLGADGMFGRETEMAVKRFQRDHGLDDDGIVGEMTWAILTGQTRGLINLSSTNGLASSKLIVWPEGPL